MSGPPEEGWSGSENGEDGSGIETLNLITELEGNLYAMKTKLSETAAEQAQTLPESALSSEIKEIGRLSMSEWHTQIFTPPPSGRVLSAFYRELPSWSSGNGSNQGPIGQGLKRANQPDRVVIHSEALISELEGITQLHQDRSLACMKPPYKALLYFRSQIKHRLAELKSEIEAKATSPEHEENQRPEDESATPKATGDSRSANGAQCRTNELLNRLEALEMLDSFIDTDLEYSLQIQAQIQNGKSEAIEFQDLWMLFSPGDLVYSREYGFEQLHRVYSTTGGQLILHNNSTESQREMLYPPPPRMRLDEENSDLDDPREMRSFRMPGNALGLGSWSTFWVCCYTMKTNGTHVGPSAYYSPIPRYIGTRKISDLPIFPSRFLPNEQQVFSRLEGRGRSCLLCEGHKRYDDFPRDIGGRPSHNRVNGDVYVDPGEYYGSRKRADEPRLGFLPIQTPVGGEIEEIVERSSVRYWLDHDVDRQRSDIFLANDIQSTISDISCVLKDPEKLRLMSHQVVAFAFRPRKWVRLEIEQVKEIDKSDTARNSGWEDLTISTKYRRLLVSLVDSHTSDTSQLAQNPSRDTPALNQLDLVRGKGMGLNILLHGPPGTGKTSTAETIAAYTGRSLYSITCGDLGTTARDVESRLNKHTDRAGKWGSVLLLDEADVFLMKRDYKDTQRNALVSVFLRVIEYYSGILFLTTNRVGVIDEAFKSRMHVSLRYPKIRLPQTREIWKGCLDRIQRDNETREIKVEFDRHDLLEFAEEHYNEHRGRHATWNGRQIRNAFQTAIAMGEYERVSKIKRKGLTTEEALAKGKRKYRVVQLTRKNLETIAETAQEFEKYMKSVHRLPDADLAKKEELRDDDFSEPSVDLAPVEKHSRRRVATGKSLHKKKPAKTAASSTAQPSASHGNKTAVADEDSSSEESTYGQGQQEASSDSSDSEED